MKPEEFIKVKPYLLDIINRNLNKDTNSVDLELEYNDLNYKEFSTVLDLKFSFRINIFKDPLKLANTIIKVSKFMLERYNIKSNMSKDNMTYDQYEDIIAFYINIDNPLIEKDLNEAIIINRNMTKSHNTIEKYNL